jgi:hypothetical protein
MSWLVVVGAKGRVALCLIVDFDVVAIRDAGEERE